MSIDSRYKDEMDHFCRETYKVGGEEMLQMAKRSSITVTENIAEVKTFGKKALLIPIAAALFGMTAVTAAAGAAGYGPLSGMFTKYFGDGATEKLAEEGYIYTAEDYAADSSSETDDKDRVYAVMGETIYKDGFSAKIIGFAGDTQAPRMLLDITVEDEQKAAQSDMLGLYVLTLGAEEFDLHRENYLEEYAKAVKDESVPNLYHANVTCPPAWVTSGEQVVVDIISIHTMEDNSDGRHEYYRDEEVLDHGISPDDFFKSRDEAADPDPNKITADNYYEKIKEYITEMQFRFTIPDNIFKTSEDIVYEGVDLVYKINGYPYHLCRAEFGAHETWATLAFDLSEGYPAEEFNSSEQNWTAAKTIAEKFTLTVDGKEYAPDIERTGLFCDTEGDCNLCVKNKCYIGIFFPAVDYENAESIILTSSDPMGETASHEMRIAAADEPADAPADETESEPAGYSWLDYPAPETSETDSSSESAADSTAE